MRINTDTAFLVRLLAKKGRASAADLGTNAKTMKVLEAAGIVTTDGFVKTGKQGKPPAAWVLVEGHEAIEVPVIEVAEPVVRGVPQATIDAIIADVSATYRGCHCIADAGVGTTQAEIRAMGAGCTSPRWVCGALDAVRRRANLVAPIERIPEIGSREERAEAEVQA